MSTNFVQIYFFCRPETSFEEAAFNFTETMRNNQETFPMLTSQLKHMFLNDEIHTACVQGPAFNIRGWKDCNFVSTSKPNVLMLVKESN